MGLVLAWITSSLGLWIASKTLKDVKLGSDSDALWAGALLAVLDATLSWLITVVIGIGTLGLGFLLWFITRWVASAIVIILASNLSSRLLVRTFPAALVTAFIVSATGSVLRWLM